MSTYCTAQVSEVWTYIKKEEPEYSSSANTDVALLDTFLLVTFTLNHKNVFTKLPLVMSGQVGALFFRATKTMLPGRLLNICIT
jgi:hypothetical protein